MSRDPWLDYWTSRDAKGVAGCLPRGQSQFAAVLDPIWNEFARHLRGGCRVLDLATGDGTVLRKLQAARPGLKLVGIDSAASLPEPPRGIKLCPGVAMEELPFPAGHFGAATSQFGMEYGNTERIAQEIGRVLRPDGRFLLIMHHRSSGIVDHNQGRRKALVWAVHESGMLDKAKLLVATGGLVQIGTPKAFRDAILEARQQFPTQLVAAEIMAAIAQTLDLGRQRPVTETHALLGKLETKATDEIARLEALDAAASDAGRAESISLQLKAAGLRIHTIETLFESSKRPLAWVLRGESAAVSV